MVNSPILFRQQTFQIRTAERGLASLRLIQKDELVAAKPDIATLQLREGEPALAIEIKNFFRLRELIRISADPIDSITPVRHSAVASSVMDPCPDVRSKRQRCQGS